jgi:hypothetical protein
MTDDNLLSAGHNDFQKIKGIGKVTAQALYDRGIHTYEDLARCTPAGLVDLLKGKIPDLSLRRIEKEDWPAQARSLMDTPLHQENWREVADFFVSFGYLIDAEGREHFQTKVHHSQADKLARWDGNAVQAVVKWILKQANLPELENRATPAPPMKIPAQASEAPDLNEEEEEARITLSDVFVSEVRVLAGSATEVNDRLHIEARLNLVDSRALNLAYFQVPYSVEFYLVDTETNQSKLMHSYFDRLSPDSQTYPISQDIKTPEAGRYQLFLFARLLPPATGAAQVQGPVIRVEEA